MADCLVLYCHLKWGLPISTLVDAGWTVMLPDGTSSGGAGFQVMQRLMLPESVAFRVVGSDTVQVAVDAENMLTLRAVQVDDIEHLPNGLHEYIVHATRGAAYERIATGSTEDAAFFCTGKRVLLGLSVDIHTLFCLVCHNRFHICFPSMTMTFFCLFLSGWPSLLLPLAFPADVWGGGAGIPPSRRASLPGNSVSCSEWSRAR